MRKVFGIILIIIGWTIALLDLSYILGCIFRIAKSIYRNQHGLAYVVGVIFFTSLLAYLSYWLVKIGLKLTKKKKVNDLQEKIESIK